MFYTSKKKIYGNKKNIVPYSKRNLYQGHNIGNAIITTNLTTAKGDTQRNYQTSESFLTDGDNYVEPCIFINFNFENISYGLPYNYDDILKQECSTCYKNSYGIVGMFINKIMLL